MAAQTTRLGLNKAEASDLVRRVLVDLFNQNWDIVDTLAREEDLDNHASDGNLHVTKDGALQTGLNAEMVGGKRADELAPAAHHHYDEHYTKTEADGRYAFKDEVYSLGDSRYALADTVYTKQESDALFARQADVYLKPEADAKFAPLSGVYTRSEADGRFAAKTEVYTKIEADLQFAARDQVYNKTDADARFAAKDQVYTIEQTNNTFVSKDLVYTKLESDNRYVQTQRYQAHVHAERSAVKFDSLDFYWELDTTLGATAPQWAAADTAYSGMTQVAAGASLTCLTHRAAPDYSAYLLFSLAGVDYGASAKLKLIYLWSDPDNYSYVELDIPGQTLRVYSRAGGVDTLLKEVTGLPAFQVKSSTKNSELTSPPEFGPAYAVGVTVSGTDVEVYLKGVSAAVFSFDAADRMHSYTTSHGLTRSGFALEGAAQITLHRFVVDVAAVL